MRKSKITIREARLICRGIGYEGLRRLNASGLTPDEKGYPVKLWDFLQDMFETKVNFRVHGLELM